MKKVISVLVIAILSLCALSVSSQTTVMATISNTNLCVGSTVSVSYTTSSPTNTNYVYVGATIGSNTVSSIITVPSFSSTGVLTVTVPSSGLQLAVRFGINTMLQGIYVYIPISIYSTPTLVVSNGTICVGQSFTISPSGAVNYSITGSNFTVTPNSSTMYTITGFNHTVCPTTTTIVAVNVNSNPTVVVSSGSICAGKTYTLPLLGASTYSLNNVAISSPYTVAPSSNTTYSVTGTSSAGCVSAFPTTVNVVVNPTINISVQGGTVCAGQTFTIQPVGASNYTYSVGANSVFIPLTTTSFSVVGTHTNGCKTNSAVATVTVHSLPVVSVNSGTICNGQLFTMVPTGASTYTFSNGTSTVNPSANSSYSVTGTSSVGCVSSNTAVSTITVHAIPIVYVNSGTICVSDIFTMNPTGASTYTFSNGTSTVSPSINSSYSVTGTSSVGCLSSNTAVASVTVYSRPTISVNSGSICLGQIFTIVPSGASSYSVAGGSFTVSPSSNVSYTVIGTSSAGCVNTVPVTASITVNALPVVSVSSSTNSLCEGNTATITAAGASTYVWTGGSNGNGSQIIVTPSITTSYTVAGTDSNGCENITSFTQTVVVCTNTTTGVVDNMMNISIRIYPVPANDEITIELNGVSNFEVVLVTIYSMDGRVVVSSLRNLNNNIAKFDLSTVQFGVYMLELKSDSFRLIKNIIVAR